MQALVADPGSLEEIERGVQSRGGEPIAVITKCLDRIEAVDKNACRGWCLM
jgi:hypothetical protein